MGLTVSHDDTSQSLSLISKKTTYLFFSPLCGRIDVLKALKQLEGKPGTAVEEGAAGSVGVE